VYLDGRDLYQFRVWRREGGYSEGQNETLAPKTLDSALTTVRSFLRFCAQIEAVHEDLYEKVPLPALSASDEVSDSMIEPERVPPIMDYLYRYEYAGRDHVTWLLIWHTGARIGGIRALDLQDLSLEGSKPRIEFVHRPETGTPLKNGELGERVNRINNRMAGAIQAYIDGPRKDVTDEHGRSPLVTTAQGRETAGCLRDAVYRWNRPCWVNLDCPAEEDPATCKYTNHDHMSKCPAARSPHDIRKARVTKYRNDGVPRGVVSDRLDASEQVLDKHYDRASKHEKADRRWRLIQE
jgi:integrase